MVLYGMGNGADKIISVLNGYGIKPSGVFSSADFVREKTFHEMPLLTYERAKELFPGMIVLLCFGTGLPRVIENIRKIAAETELYAPDVPVCGGELFDIRFARRNAEKIGAVYKMLADETSKKTYENIIRYKLSGDINLLFGCETAEDEAFSGFFACGCNENFLDLGAYRGDTVLSFVSRAKKWQSITAVEPDRKTFAKLCENTKDIKNIKLLNAAVSDRCGSVLFGEEGSRGSHIGTGVPVNSVSADGILPKNGFSLIKVDTEGAETAFLNGAAKTIERFRPKMQIAAYHKSADIFEIPLKVAEMYPDYKVYLRHFPCLPAWDTNYFFVP